MFQASVKFPLSGTVRTYVLIVVINIVHYVYIPVVHILHIMHLFGTIKYGSI